MKRGRALMTLLSGLIRCHALLRWRRTLGHSPRAARVGVVARQWGWRGSRSRPRALRSMPTGGQQQHSSQAGG
jgi:hypothetical protein